MVSNLAVPNANPTQSSKTRSTTYLTAITYTTVPAMIIHSSRLRKTRSGESTSSVLCAERNTNQQTLGWRGQHDTSYTLGGEDSGVAPRSTNVLDLTPASCGNSNADDPARRSKMDNQESQSRIEALRNAIQHKLRGATADDIVESAEKFFEFLQGDSKTDE